ncbi:nuclear transport factor 2 family protein [Shewanella cyperi]|uniref:Nuclear transport factor 2 family protein n=1 Tax=Shewanella cyperi TaxID=2814292 RepID=A0A974XI03_9GAMM|nr:nuclear transport factor 2 family protein [Shewanella cyperi]QSX28664.1 nuclear transport factor 2 family protein [Shewanella cyperi]
MADHQEKSLHDIILARENEWMGAWLKRDRALADSILADEFTLVSSLNGEIFSKAQWLDGAMGPIVCQSFHFDRLQVKGYGDTVVSIAWYHQKATARGNDWSGEFRMTDVWHYRDGRWQVVARHSTWLGAAAQQ